MIKINVHFSFKGRGGLPLVPLAENLGKKGLKNFQSLIDHQLIINFPRLVICGMRLIPQQTL